MTNQTEVLNIDQNAFEYFLEQFSAALVEIAAIPNDAKVDPEYRISQEEQFYIGSMQINRKTAVLGFEVRSVGGGRSAPFNQYQLQSVFIETAAFQMAIIVEKPLKLIYLDNSTDDYNFYDEFGIPDFERIAGPNPVYAIQGTSYINEPLSFLTDSGDFGIKLFDAIIKKIDDAKETINNQTPAQQKQNNEKLNNVVKQIKDKRSKPATHSLVAAPQKKYSV